MINRTILEGFIHNEPHFVTRNGKELDILTFKIRWEMDSEDGTVETFYFDVEVYDHDKKQMKKRFHKGDKVIVAGALILMQNQVPLLAAHTIFKRSK